MWTCEASVYVTVLRSAQFGPAWHCGAHSSESHTENCRMRGGGGGGLCAAPIGWALFQTHSDWLVQCEQGIPQGSLCLCLRLKTQTVQSGLAAPGSPPVRSRPGLNQEPDLFISNSTAVVFKTRNLPDCCQSAVIRSSAAGTCRN